MTEPDKAPENNFTKAEPLIKSLFSRLTEIILGSIVTPTDVACMLIAVSQWTALIAASLIVMVEQEDSKKSAFLLRNFLGSLQQETILNIRTIRKLKGKEESRIIT